MAHKELQVKMDIEGYYVIQYDKGGSLPKELSGIYNRRKYAEEAIENYLKEKNKPKRSYRKSRSTTNGENTSTES